MGFLPHGWWIVWREYKANPGCELYTSPEWEWSVIRLTPSTQGEVKIILLKPVTDKLHNKLMPDRLFSVLFLVQHTLVAAWFLFHHCSLLTFFLYSVFIRCCECMGVFFLSPWLLASACYLWSFSPYCVWSVDGSTEPAISQLQSQNSVRVGGWGTGDVQSSRTASWRQTFVLPPLLGRRRQSWTRCLLFHTPHSVCSGKKEGALPSLPLPLSALLCSLHLVHLWLSPSWLQLQGRPSFQLLPMFFQVCSRNKKDLL